VPGFDLTFRAPKSVSLLYGLGDERTAESVRAAHDAAVAAAVGWLEAEAARSRRGHGGSERVAVTGFVAAAFRHRSSRARDPLLHTHVLVANLARTVDDRRWRTLDTAALYTCAVQARQQRHGSRLPGSGRSSGRCRRRPRPRRLTRPASGQRKLATPPRASGRGG